MSAPVTEQGGGADRRSDQPRAAPPDRARTGRLPRRGRAARPPSATSPTSPSCSRPSSTTATRAAASAASTRRASRGSSTSPTSTSRRAPTVDPALLAALDSCEWVERGEPVVLLGDSGTGKSHLLIGLGMAACQRGLRVRYTTAAQLVNELAEAADERTLSRLVARYGRLDLLLPRRVRLRPPRPARRRVALPDPDRARGAGLGGGRLQCAVLGVGPHLHRRPPRRRGRLTASPSAPTSSRPAATPIACGSPPPRREVRRQADHTPGGGASFKDQGGAKWSCHSQRMVTGGQYSRRKASRRSHG